MNVARCPCYSLKNRGHYDPQGVHIPAFWAEEDEIFALADVLSELGGRHHPEWRRARCGVAEPPDDPPR